ncbi:SDR family NAD(P)-dependent oxidoreductase [Actinokineospora bangkokensis]|uniref:Short-chain dehydrogenase n=1 Tax=Actinokineospora bangkokensis TaxID=1193682 RepID=A0A1Q9LK04_9PSEU|nr:SDR family oxidoreductase [Actinokineospora bangkokensis]OLR92333.1 short-chain dehydrogenase [Actinokineospora bangkokensis]
MTRHALVTGSTSGIGAATARALAAAGHRVVITGRDAARGAALARETGGTFLPADLAAPPADLRAFAHRALDALDGRVDLLVNNAATCPPVATPDLSDEALAQVLAVNVRAPHVLVAALAPGMVERGGGVVITIGSWMASTGAPFAALYSASKAAEQQLTRSWAAEFGPRGVRVVGVAPGVTRDGDDDPVAARITAASPAGRPVTPAAVADAVLWLASPAAAFVQGTTVAVDGGIGSTWPVWDR